MSVPVFAGKGNRRAGCEWWKGVAVQEGRKGDGCRQVLDSGLHLTC